MTFGSHNLIISRLNKLYRLRKRLKVAIKYQHHSIYVGRVETDSHIMLHGIISTWQRQSYVAAKLDVGFDFERTLQINVIFFFYWPKLKKSILKL